MTQSLSFPLHRLGRARLLMVPINSIRLDKPFSGCFPGVAEANSQRALEMAQKLSHQLRAAEARINELEAEIGIYQEKADRAEQWLHESTLRLRTDFCGRTTAVVKCPSGLRVPALRGE